MFPYLINKRWKHVRYFRLLKNSIMGGDAGAFISAAAEAMMSSTASVTS